MLPSIQAQVVSLSSTLDSLIGMLKSMTGIKSAPQTKLIPGGSPLFKFEVESPKASFKEALDQKSPSPQRSDRDDFAVSSIPGNPAASNSAASQDRY